MFLWFFIELWKFNTRRCFVLETTEIIIVALSCVLSVCIGASIGYFLRRKISEAKIGSAEKEADNIVSKAKTEAEAKKKEILLL